MPSEEKRPKSLPCVSRFLMTKEKASDYHSNDLARRLKRWAEPTDRAAALRPREVPGASRRGVGPGRRIPSAKFNFGPAA